MRLDPLPPPRPLQTHSYHTCCLRNSSPSSLPTPTPSHLPFLPGFPSPKGLPFLQAPGRTPRHPKSLSDLSTIPPAPGYLSASKALAESTVAPDPVPVSFAASSVLRPTPSPQAVPSLKFPAYVTSQGLSTPEVDHTPLLPVALETLSAPRIKSQPPSHALEDRSDFSTSQPVWLGLS